MFLSFLEQEEKNLFWKLANEIVAIDGNIAEEEKELLKVYLKELQNVEENVKKRDVKEVYADKHKRNILILELLGLAFADGNYDKTEKEFIERLALELEVSNEKINRMIEWIDRQKELYKEIKTILED